MRFIPTKFAGAFIIEHEPIADSRGWFGRSFCARDFAEQGLTNNFVQWSTSFSLKRGTLRGLHYQRTPHAEVKLIRCVAGAALVMIVDFRQGSPTYLENLGVELTPQNERLLYVPEMFAQGFQTLADNTEVHYYISEFYAPDHATGLRYNDPQLGVSWPLEVTSISEKDKAWPLLQGGTVS
jgi:dTDP-4-dehydrorhamnose 3,5-epimerase